MYVTQSDIIFLSETWKSEAFINKLQDPPKAYLQLGQTSAMQPFLQKWLTFWKRLKTVNLFSQKYSTVDVPLGSTYASTQWVIFM